MPTRYKASGCFPWCGKKCYREQDDDCPLKSEVPQIVAPEPNTLAGSIGMLKYGMRDYEAEQVQHGKELSIWWRKNKGKSQKSPRPKDWRNKLSPPDPWAMIPIYRNQKMEVLWSTQVVYEVLIDSPSVTVALHNCVTNKCPDYLVNELASAVFSVLVHEYRKKCKVLNVRKDCKEIDEKKWDQIFNSFSRCKKILAWFLIEFYQDDVPFWSARVAKYVPLSDDWRAWMSIAKSSASLGGIVFRNKKTRELFDARRKTAGRKSSSGLTGIKFKKAKPKGEV